MKDAHGQGLLVRAWNTDKEDDMRRLIDLGVDAIGSDRPDLLLDSLSTDGDSVKGGPTRVGVITGTANDESNLKKRLLLSVPIRILQLPLSPFLSFRRNFFQRPSASFRKCQHN